MTIPRCEAVDFNGDRCDLMAGHGGAHQVLGGDPAAPVPAEPRRGMDDWQRFALLVFALVLLVGVVLVYVQIKGGLDAML